jgi:TonB family protein
MGVLSRGFVIVTIVLAHETLPAQTPASMNGRAGVRSGAYGMPTKQMQFGKSSQYDVPPKFISGPAPVYPSSRLRQRESGYADIVFTVDESGHTRDFHAVKTSYLYFANHAILAVKDWRFQPATKNGHPVSCRLRIPFTYRCN